MPLWRAEAVRVQRRSDGRRRLAFLVQLQQPAQTVLGAHLALTSRGATSADRCARRRLLRDKRLLRLTTGIGEQPDEVGRAQRLAPEEALRSGAAEPAEQIQLLAGLHTLGDRRDAERTGEVHDRRDDGEVVAVVGHRLHEDTVNLQRRQGEPPQV